MNLIDVATTNTTGLVAFYNANSGKPQIKKFANRTIAEFRVRQLIEEMKAVAELDLLEHEMTDTIEELKTDEVVDEPQTDDYDPADDVVDPLKRSKGIAASWLNPETAAKRKQRHGCRVDGVEYRSVPAAFDALGLPGKHMQMVRAQLKEHGVLEYGEGDNLKKFELL